MEYCRIPLNIDAIGLARKNMPVKDLMEVLKGCVQRQIHEMGRSVLSELSMRGTVSIPETFHLKPGPLGHFCSIVFNKNGTCAGFCELPVKLPGFFSQILNVRNIF